MANNFSSGENMSERNRHYVADFSEIRTGPATILSNVSGTEVTEYKVEITRIYTGAEAIGSHRLICGASSLLSGLTCSSMMSWISAIWRSAAWS